MRVIEEVVNPFHHHGIQSSIERNSKHPHYPLYNWWAIGAVFPSRLDSTTNGKQIGRPWIARCGIAHPRYKDGTIVLVQPLESTCNVPILGAVICNIEELKEHGPKCAFKIFKEGNHDVEDDFLREMRMDPTMEFDCKLVMDGYLEYLMTTRRIYDPRRLLSINATMEYWSKDNAALKAERDNDPNGAFFFDPNEGDQIFHKWYTEGGCNLQTQYEVPIDGEGNPDYKSARIVHVQTKTGDDYKAISSARKEILAERRKRCEEAQQQAAKAKAEAEAAAKVSRAAAKASAVPVVIDLVVPREPTTTGNNKRKPPLAKYNKKRTTEE